MKIFHRFCKSGLGLKRNVVTFWIFFLVIVSVYIVSIIIQKDIQDYSDYFSDKTGLNGSTASNVANGQSPCISHLRDSENDIEDYSDCGSHNSCRTPGKRATLPVFAYLITGSKGDGERMKRLLLSIYHPRNEYLLHLDLEASTKERQDLRSFLIRNPIITSFKNVHLVVKSNLVNYRGSTMIAAYLHGAAILLKRRLSWDWFINLSSSDYPLMTQDDLANAFSPLPRNLNFVEHQLIQGWNRFQRARPLMVDPAIYSRQKQSLFWPTERRAMPTAFNLFQGSAWVVLSRPFVEYVLIGWDNLPRLALMYFSNFVSSPESYFQTVLCNSCQYRNSTINTDLRYIQWHTPPRQHPKTLTDDHFDDMAASGALFARKFARNGAVLDTIDRKLLGRCKSCFVPGGWCVGGADNGSDPCSSQGVLAVERLTAANKRLRKALEVHLNPASVAKAQCKI